MSKSNRHKAKKACKVHKANPSAALVACTPETVAREQVPTHPFPVSELMPFDAYLLERAQTQWQFGDWESLAAIDAQALEHHPERARLALLAAAGQAQQGDADQTRALVRQALDWGVDRQLVKRVLISGVHHSLGRAAAVTRQPSRALAHVEASIRVGAPGNDPRLLIQARIQHQFEGAGLPRLDAPRHWSDPRTRGARRQDQGLGHTEDAEPRPPQAVETRASAPENALFHCRVELDGQAFTVGFKPASPELYRLQDGVLSFRLPPGKPGYLVSNETGEFNIAPSVNQLPLAPDTAYEISVHIACDDCEEPPIVWLFEYAEGKKLESRSFRTHGGEFKGYFRTQKSRTTSFAVGIRINGEGRLDVAATRIRFISGQAATLAELIESKLTERLSQAQSKLRTEQQRSSKNTLAQVENFIRLQSYMGADFLMPDMHAWPISPDLGVLLIRLVEAERYDAVIEFGSGVSTVILARALSKKGDAKDGRAPYFLSFEHLDTYFEKTTKILHQARLQERVDLVFAPLIPFSSDGHDYRYYDCGAALRRLRDQLTVTSPRILVLVDGPPAATGPHARYPALPMLMDVFAVRAHLDILMDDYIRTDEREILMQWEALLNEQGHAFVKQEYPAMEKQACLLKVERRPS